MFLSIFFYIFLVFFHIGRRPAVFCLNKPVVRLLKIARVICIARLLFEFADFTHHDFIFLHDDIRAKFCKQVIAPSAESLIILKRKRFIVFSTGVLKQFSRTLKINSFQGGSGLSVQSFGLVLSLLCVLNLFLCAGNKGCVFRKRFSAFKAAVVLSLCKPGRL